MSQSILIMDKKFIPIFHLIDLFHSLILSLGLIFKINFCQFLKFKVVYFNSFLFYLIR
jgi:hypothetical protein